MTGLLLAALLWTEPQAAANWQESAITGNYPDGRVIAGSHTPKEGWRSDGVCDNMVV